MKYEIKVDPRIYGHLSAGTLTFNVCKAQDGYQFGDTVIFREWDTSKVNPTDDAPKGYTGSPELAFVVGYIHVLSTFEAIISLTPVKKPRLS